jgi:hypothetical protein
MRFVFGLLVGIIIGAVAMYLLAKSYNVSLGPLEHGVNRPLPDRQGAASKAISLRDDASLARGPGRPAVGPFIRV